MQMRRNAQRTSKLDRASAERPTTKLSSKGQIVIPREVRDALQWHQGDTIVIDLDGAGDAVVLRRESPFGPALTAADVSGILADKVKRKLKGMTDEEMTQKAHEAFVRRWKRTGG